VDPVVPPGYGFAILAQDGRVLFHSDEGLSLEENFFDEIGDPDTVRQAAQSGRTFIWSGEYHGRPHRLYMRPMLEFLDCPWRIVTFQSMEPLLAAEFQRQSGIFRLGILNVLVAKGLITERPAPTIFNYTFRAFLREIERDQVVHEWERMEGSGLWVVAGRLIASTLVAGGLFYLLTQDFSVQTLLPIISGSGFFGVPLIRDLLARVSMKPGAASLSA